MLRGCIDAVTSCGYVEGWAFDSTAPLRPLHVSVLAGAREVARGVANRYRWDLAEAGCGSGWCGFRLRLSGPVSRLRRQGLSLRDLTHGGEIHHAADLPLEEDHEPGLAALGDVIAADPTLVHAIEQLSGCGAAFSDFIAARGADEFVRAAYVYVFGRGVDAAGLAAYAAMLQDGSLLPYELLQILYDSDEFRSVPRHLLAPPEPGFVFRGA